MKYGGNGLETGLSSDTKPTFPLGYRFYEMDTGDMFVSDGTYWWLAGMPSPFSSKKVGYFSMGSSTTAGIGMMSALTAATNPGSQNFGISDGPNGRFATGISGTTTGNKGGWRVATNLTSRQWNPRVRIKFKLVSNTLQRIYFGFIGNANPPAEPTGDDPFGAANSGITFGCTSAATNFEVLHNDTTGSTVVDNTAVPLDTNVNTVSIVADQANSKFAWKLNSGAYQDVVADIPSSSGLLSFCVQNETNESGVAKSFQLYNAFVQADK